MTSEEHAALYNSTPDNKLEIIHLTKAEALQRFPDMRAHFDNLSEDGGVICLPAP